MPVSTNYNPQKIIGNEENQERIRKDFPEWSKAMVKVMASGKGPIIGDVCPDWPHDSGGPWIKGITKNGETCWV